MSDMTLPAARLSSAVDPPPWIANLPVDARGFHIPAEAGWNGDQPQISVVETARKTMLLLRRACAVCGHHLPRELPIFRAFGQFDAAQIRGFEAHSTQDIAGPVHKSCILYSAMVCPYLRERNSRLSKDNAITPGARRGTLAAVMGFRRMSLLIYAEPHEFLSPSAPVPHAGYLELCEDIRYRDGSELTKHYEAAVATDGEHIDLASRSSYWTDIDTKEFVEELHSHFKRLNRSRADYQLIIRPNRFVGFVQ